MQYFVVLNPSHTRDVSVLCLHLFYGVEDMRVLCRSCSMRVDKNQIFEEMEKSRLKISCPLMASFLLDKMKDLWVDTSEWYNHVSTRKFNCISGLHLRIFDKDCLLRRINVFLTLATDFIHISEFNLLAKYFSEVTFPYKGWPLKKKEKKQTSTKTSKEKHLTTGKTVAVLHESSWAHTFYKYLMWYLVGIDSSRWLQ